MEGGSCLGTHVRIKDFKIKKKNVRHPPLLGTPYCFPVLPFQLVYITLCCTTGLSSLLFILCLLSLYISSMRAECLSVD